MKIADKRYSRRVFLPFPKVPGIEELTEAFKNKIIPRSTQIVLA